MKSDVVKRKAVGIFFQLGKVFGVGFEGIDRAVAAAAGPEEALDSIAAIRAQVDKSLAAAQPEEALKG